MDLRQDPPFEPDPVIDAFKPGIDVTLLDENLRRTLEQRFQGLESMARLHEAARRARARGVAPVVAAGAAGPAR